jgi:hypothetical protein
MNFEYVVNQFTKTHIVHVPIRSIDGVKLSVYFHQLNEVIYLVVCYYNYIDERYVISGQIDFDIITAKIRCWKFDKLSNAFVDESEPVADPEFYKCFESPTIKLQFEECSVCIEKTIGKTQCKHPICLACLTNLKRPKCPLCRADIDPNLYESDENE